MSLRIAAAFGCLAFSCIATAAATTQPADQTPGFSLTIYSLADPATFDPAKLLAQRAQYYQYSPQWQIPGYGVVREIRPINLHRGNNTVSFTDVASGIDPTTVSFTSLTAPTATSVLEQNYEYDLVSADKLLSKYLGKVINIRRSVSQGGDLETISGTLLSADNGNLVLRTRDGAVSIIPRSSNIQQIEVEGDANLITKPTLVWKIHTDQAGTQDARVTYQTDNLTWRADYNVLISPDDKAANLGAWVSILNESGASYPDAHVKLVAGDVQRIQPAQVTYRVMAMQNAALKEADASGGFAEKAFFEYHLYTLGRTTSLPDNSTKQIELFPTRMNVPVTKTYVYYGLPSQYQVWNYDQPNLDRNFGTQCNKKVDVYLQLRNDKAHELGIPLPAGRIRVYKTDEADGSQEFIGEDVIQHTPKDEDVLIKLGSAFDIVGERRQTNFSEDADGHIVTESFEIKLRNHKDVDANVIIKENLYRWTNWEITECSANWSKRDFRTIHIPVRVPANGEKTVTYTVRYTWR
ncbi:MAG TPA: hypothetical protein VG722_10420 [Tepidisphaeraceae bacterium]|nr:hypothetical protein [Tepidisphaeraceae bacterium]